MKLEEHIRIFKALGFIPNRNALIRMVWTIASEHPETNAEDFIKAISERPTSNIVEPIKEK
jgi:hypothetical protein